jgi:hypothetical protein
MVASMKMTTVWDIAPCSLVEIDRCFRGAFCALMEAVVYFNETTRRYIPEGYHLQPLFKKHLIVNVTFGHGNKLLHPTRQENSPFLH